MKQNPFSPIYSEQTRLPLLAEVREEEQVLTYEQVLKLAGPENKYQMRVGILVALGMVIAGLQVMSFPFIFKETSVECLNSHNKWEACEINERSCQGQIRLKEGGYQTITASFSQFCEGSNPRILIETIYMIASAIGVAAIGPIGDIYGKRKALLISYFITCFSLLACAFVPTWHIFMICIFLSGLGRAPFIYYGFQLLVEVSNEKFRAYGTLIMGVAFACGAGVAGLFSSTVDYDWRKLYFYYLALPSCLAIPLVYFWADESPLSFFPLRNYDKARAGLQKIASVNKRQLPSFFTFVEEKSMNEDSFLKEKVEEGAMKGAHAYSILDLLKYKSLRMAALGGAYICFATYFVFYGQMLAIDSLSNDPVTVSIVTSVVEAIACVSSVKLLTHFTRRRLLIMSFSFVAIAFVIFGGYPVCEKGMECSHWRVFIGFLELSIGRFWIAILMCTTFIYTNELFPTVIRSRGSGLVNFFGRIGSFLPSSVIYLCNEANISPALIFGFVAVPAVVVSLFMKETKGKPLQNEIEEEAISSVQFTKLHDDENLLTVSS